MIIALESPAFAQYKLFFKNNILTKVVPLIYELIEDSVNPWCNLVKDAVNAYYGDRVLSEFYMSLERFLATNWETSWPNDPCPSATANKLWF